MKKKISVFLGLMMLAGVGTANAFTAYFDVTDIPGLSDIDSFGFETSADPASLTQVIYFDQVVTPLAGKIGAVPENKAVIPNFGEFRLGTTTWDIFKTTTPMGVSGFNPGVAPLIPGLVLSLTGNEPFELTEFYFGSSLYEDGKFPGDWQIKVTSLADGASYSVTAPVPVPAAAWLLGTGLVGLLGLRRKNAA